GVIVASLDPAYLTRIYDSVNVGSDGQIRVIGTDGVVRATSGRSQTILGQDFSSGDLFKNYGPAKPSGWHYTASRWSDQVPRMVVYRGVKDYPLIITVGRSTREIFGRLALEQQMAYLVATLLTLLILAAAGFSIRGHWLREQATKRLQRTNMLLNAALANMPHGLCMVGPDRRLVVANDLYSTMYGVNPDRIGPGTSLAEILRARIDAGASPADEQRYLKAQLT